jgi:hypothetical protein
MPDRAGAALDEDLLSADVAVGEQAAMRGHGRNAKARAELERRALRQRHRLFGWQRDPLRRGPLRALPLAVVQPNALATRRPSTSSPTATISPEPSWSGTIRS